MYSKPDCVECIKLKAILNMKGVEFEELDAMENMDFLSSSGIRSLPAIFNNQGAFISLKDAYEIN